MSVLLLTASNVFMTFAWYAHLKELNHKPWIIAAMVSWGITLFEYLLQVPANRIGFRGCNEFCVCGPRDVSLERETYGTEEERPWHIARAAG